MYEGSGTFAESLTVPAILCGRGGKIACLPDAWNAAILDAPGSASRTNADRAGTRDTGVLRDDVAREVMLRLAGVALRTCLSIVGRRRDAIASEWRGRWWCCSLKTAAVKVLVMSAIPHPR